jgi:hypothetical protein
MEAEGKAMTPSMAEAWMVEPELVRQIRGLAAQGWGAKRTARELEESRYAASATFVRNSLLGGAAACFAPSGRLK